jgi:lipoprotein NlpD
VSARLRERSPRKRGRQALGIALLAAAASLAGCASLTYEPNTPPKGDAGTYVVRKGDTLFKIAWQHGVDQRDLARWNGIRDPDVIHVGEKIRLAPPGRSSRRAEPAAAPPSPAAPPPEGKAQQRSVKSGAASPRGPSASDATAPTSTAPPSASVPTLPPPAWGWPTDGDVVTRFGSTEGIATGIGIGGREGQAVRAAAAGRVVYAGSGLMSYGQLLIIKHNDTYLSAYGYNSRLLVAQGQDVAKGQTIAAMGRGPEREPRLHFEIRRNGVPVDPLLLVSVPR